MQHDYRLAGAMVFGDDRRRAGFAIHEQRPGRGGAVAVALDHHAAGVRISGRDGYGREPLPVVVRPGQPRAFGLAHFLSVAVVPFQRDDPVGVVGQRVIAVVAQVGPRGIGVTRHDVLKVLPEAGPTPELQVVGALPREPLADMDVAPGAPGGNLAGAALETAVVGGVHDGPQCAVGHPDAVVVLPDGRPVFEPAQGGGRIIVVSDFDGSPVAVVHAVIHCPVGLETAEVGGVNAEQGVQLGLGRRARLAPAVLDARQIGDRDDMNAGGQHHRAQIVIECLAAGVRDHVVAAHVAGEDQHAEVGIGAGGQLIERHDEVRFIAEPLERAGLLLHFIFKADILGIRGIHPEERDVRRWIPRAGEQPADVHLLELVVKIAAFPHGGLVAAVGGDDAETLLAVGHVWPVLPGEDVSADAAAGERLPEAVADQDALANLVYAREKGLGAGETRLAVHHRDAGDLLGVGDAPLAVAGLMAIERPRIIVDREETQRRAGCRAGARDLAAVLSVVAPVLLAPLHPDGGVGEEMVRVGRVRGLCAKSGERGDGILMPLDHVRPERAGGPFPFISVGEDDLAEAGVGGTPSRVERYNVRVAGLAPVAESLFAPRVIAVVFQVPKTEIAVFIADDPTGDRFRIFVTAADVGEELGVLRARLRMLVIDDVGLPAFRMINAFRIRAWGVHRVHVVREPVRRPLITDQGEDLDVAFFARADQVVIVVPIEKVVAAPFDVLPNEIHADGVGAHAHHIVQILVNLIMRLPNTQRPIPGLVSDPMRDERLAGCGIPKVIVFGCNEITGPRRRTGPKNEHKKSRMRASRNKSLAHNYIST